MTPQEIYDAVVLQSDVTLRELLYDRDVILYSIRQAVVDVLLERLRAGDYNAGSRVYTITGPITAIRPVDSYDGGAPTGVPLYNCLWEAVLPTGSFGEYPLIIESAYLIEPTMRRLVYLPIDIFVSANAMLGGTKLKREYSFTLLGDYMVAANSSGSGSDVYESSKQQNNLLYSDLLIWVTAPPDETPVIEIRYWREPVYSIGLLGNRIDMPDIYHGRIVSRAAQILTHLVQQVSHNQVQLAGGSRSIKSDMMQNSKQQQVQP